MIDIIFSEATKENILLVEDDPYVQRFISRTLEKFGFKVIKVNNAGEALENLRQAQNMQIHLLLTDIIMSKMNGSELADKIKSIYPQVKVLFMSGYTKGYLESMGLLKKNTEIIEKPFGYKMLIDKVKEILTKVTD